MQRRNQTTADAAAMATTGWSTTLAGTTSIQASRPADPITAARRWLEHPERGGRLHPVLRDRAQRAVTVAEQHMLRLDEYAARIAVEFETSGTMNTELLAMADDQAMALEAFSTRLRVLLDPEVVVVDAADRIERGLAAARSGGLGALVDAL